jgi:hypothetical protein
LHGSDTYIRKKWELIELMTIHPELSVVAFPAKLYTKETWSEKMVKVCK